MRTTVAATAFLICFLSAPKAHATAIYNYVSDATINFSLAWSSFTSVPTESTAVGTGQYTAAAHHTAVALGPSSFYQSANASGSAGDTGFIENGTSEAKTILYTLFTFDFGNDPTTFTITWDYNHSLSQSKQLPFNATNGTGEFVSGSAGTQLLFDGFAGAWYTKGVPVVFENVTGQHTVRLLTLAGSRATAVYPYEAPDRASSGVLLSLGLIALWIASWRHRPSQLGSGHASR